MVATGAAAPMSLVHNERLKLLANAFDRASTACFTIGVVTPVAGLIYGDVSTTWETLVFEPVMAVQFVPEPLYCQS
jgi:hypothetical protein